MYLFGKRKITAICTFMLILLFVLVLFYGLKIKTEIIPACLEDDELGTAILSYKGFGLFDKNSWYGKVPVKKFYYDTQANKYVEQIFSNGLMSFEKTYFKSGRLASSGACFQNDEDSSWYPDDLFKLYYENGTLKAEKGFRAPRKPEYSDGPDGAQHGVWRDYSEKGNIKKEEYYLYSKPCSKSDWLNHLKKEPLDIKYGK